MNMGWNLPPGCSPWDIPGNRPIDEAWDRYLTFGYHLDICERCDHMAGCDLYAKEEQEDCSIIVDDFNDWWYNEESEG